MDERGLIQMATAQPLSVQGPRPTAPGRHLFTTIFFVGLVFVFLVNSFISLIAQDYRFIFNYLGEVFVIGSIPFAVAGYFRASRAGRLVIILYVGFALCELISTLLFPLPGFPQWPAAALGLFLETKLFIVMLAVVYLASVNSTSLHRWLQVLLLLIIALVWLNMPFILRDIVDGKTNIYGEGLYRRSGIPIPTGLYGHKAVSAQMAIVSLAAVLALRVPSLSKANRVFLDASLAISILQVVVSLSVKELAATMLTLVVHYSYSRRGLGRARLLAIALVSTAAMTILLATPNPFSKAVIERVDRYTGEEADTRIRNKLISASVDIAQTNFPFGTGAGTFASEPSRSLGYSPVYVKYQFYRFVGGRARGEFQFLLDGFWPKILGEGGVAGFLFYLASITMILKEIFKRRRDFPEARIFVFVQYLWIGVLPISLASGIMTTERYVLLLGLSGICLVSLARRDGTRT